MHPPSLIVASVALLSSSIALAEPNRPKFYFPRQIKRQIFSNSTTTSQPSSSLTSPSPLDFSDLVGTGSTPDPTTADGATDGVTTIVVPQTVVIESSSTVTEAAGTAPTSTAVLPAAASSGTAPAVIVLPTTAPAIVPSAAPSAAAASGGGITFGPGGVVTTSDATADAPTTTADAPTTTSDPPPTTAVDATTTPDPTTATPDPTTTAGISFSGAAPTTDPAAAPSTTAPVLSIIPVLSSVLSDLTSDLLPPSSAAPSSAAPTSTAPATDPPATDPLTTPAPTTSDPPAPASTSAPPNLISLISSVVSDVSSDIATILPTSTPDGSAPTTAAGVTGPATGVTSDAPPPTSAAESPTDAPGTSTTELQSAPTTTAGLPADNSTVSIDTSAIGGTDPSTTAPASTLPTGTAVAGNGTATSTPPVSADSVTSFDGAAPTSIDGLAPLTIFPTGTDTATAMSLPTSLIAQPSTTLQTGTDDPSAPTSIPSSLPKVISPSTGTPDAPEDSTLIQIGFGFPLNYEFVVEHSISSAQIFNYLPVGVSDGLGLRLDEVIMHSLLPLNTEVELGYITTIALAYIPSTMVSTLALDLHIPTAAIYYNDDPRVNALLNYINPAIPLTPGSTLAGAAATGTGSASSASNAAAVEGGVYSNPTGQSGTPAVPGATAGIAMGAVSAAAAYGAAMFFIARRYKNRKQSHRRSHSTISTSEMRQSGSPALTGGGAGMFMSGGRSSPGGATNDRNSRGSRGSGRSGGNSARTAQISAPMMAENSLGWN